MKQVNRPHARVGRLESLQAVDEGSLANAVATTFVYRPGGVAGKNVYTTWPSLYAALLTVAGPKWVQVDDSIVSPAVVPAGTYNLDGVTISGINLGTVLNLTDGTHITGQTLSLFNIQVTSAATSAIWTTSTIAALYLLNEVILSMTGTGPFLSVASGGTGVVTEFNSTIGDGSHVALLKQTGGALTVNVLDASVAQGAVQGGLIAYDSAATVNLTQGAGTSFQLDSTATNTSYSPIISTNWNPAPTTVQGALDQLAAPNTVAVTNGAPLTGSHSAKLSASITKKKSGKVLVIGTMQGTDVNSEQVTFTLQVDNGGIGGIIGPQTSGASNVFSGTIQWVDTLPDTASHTYSILVTGTGNLTVGTNEAILTLVEFD